eukprot:1285657-Rhodomonas_salina.1
MRDVDAGRYALSLGEADLCVMQWKAAPPRSSCVSAVPTLGADIGVLRPGQQSGRGSGRGLCRRGRHSSARRGRWGVVLDHAACVRVRRRLRARLSDTVTQSMRDVIERKGNKLKTELHGGQPESSTRDPFCCSVRRIWHVVIEAERRFRVLQKVEGGTAWSSQE